MSVCRTCKGEGQTIPFLGSPSEPCPDCGGQGVTGDLRTGEWVRLDWTPAGEKFHEPLVTIEPDACRQRLTLKQAKALALEIQHRAEQGERLWERVKAAQEKDRPER